MNTIAAPSWRGSSRVIASEGRIGGRLPLRPLSMNPIRTVEIAAAPRREEHEAVDGADCKGWNEVYALPARIRGGHQWVHVEEAAQGVGEDRDRIVARERL